MRRYLKEPRTRKYVKLYGFLLFARKYKKQLLDTWLDPVTTASKKALHKAGEFIGNKIADAVTRLSNYKVVKPDENRRYVEEIIIPLEKQRWNIKQIENSIIKVKHYKIYQVVNILVTKYKV